MQRACRYAGISLAILVIATQSGCSMNTSLLSTQSKFVFPQGTYNLKGHAAAEKTYYKFFGGREMTREEFHDLEQQALASQPGADLMVDYVISSKVTAFPELYLPIFSVTTFRLEGTAFEFRELGSPQFRENAPQGRQRP